MKKSISILKNYFKTGDKPTQQQFYDFLESFVHLDSTILAAQVEGLETALQTLQALGINDIVGLQTALADLNTAITTLEVADVSGLQDILNALAVVSIGDVTGLQDALNALAVVSIGDVTGLQDELNNKVTAATGFGLSENNFSTNYVNIISGLTASVTALTYETIITEATATKTLALTDVNKRIMFTGATLNTVTIPLDAAVAWYSGTKIKGTVQGAGAVTIAGTGITFVGNTFTFAKGESFILTNTGLDLWTVEGNAAAVSANIVKTLYVDAINGNDTTGQVGNIFKPYKTIDALMPFFGYVNLDLNEYIVELLTAGTYFVNLSFPLYTRVTLNSVKATNISFINNPNTTILQGASGNNMFNVITPNGTITFSNTVNQSIGAEYSKIIVDVFIGNSPTPTGVLFGGMGYLFFEARETTLKKGLATPSGSGYIDYKSKKTIVNASNILVATATGNNLSTVDYGDISGTGSIILGGFSGECYVSNISTTEVNIITNNLSNVIIKFKDTIITGGGIKMSAGWSFGKVTLTGVIQSQSIGLKNDFMAGGTLILKDFSHDFKSNKIEMYDSHLILENANIRFDATPFGLASSNTKKITFYGTNSIFSVTPPAVMFTGTTATPIEKYGFLNTNIPSLATNAILTNRTPLEHGDKNFTSYPNTRNDGANPTNKILGTDANGNLKSYSMALMPAPFLKVLIPDSTLPSTTTNFKLKGAFFTPTMTVVIGGATINYITFISDNEVDVNVTTGAAEGSFPVTLNNGISATFNNALFIVLGTVYSPAVTDWINIVEPVNFEAKNMLLKTAYSAGSARWNKNLDVTKNFRVLFTMTFSPLTSTASPNTLAGNDILLIKSVLNDALLFKFNNYQNIYFDLYPPTGDRISGFGGGIGDTFRLDYISGIFYFYRNSTLITSITQNQNLTNNAYLVFSVQAQDIKDIKYIELA
jgi:hypothetical protein